MTELLTNHARSSVCSLLVRHVHVLHVPVVLLLFRSLAAHQPVKGRFGAGGRGRVLRRRGNRRLGVRQRGFQSVQFAFQIRNAVRKGLVRLREDGGTRALVSGLRFCRALQTDRRHVSQQRI